MAAWKPDRFLNKAGRAIRAAIREHRYPLASQ
jgi:hypothetical protein